MLTNEEKKKIEEEEKLRTGIRKKEEKKKQSKKATRCLILILIPVIIIVIIVLASSGGDKKTSEPQTTKLSIGEEGILNNNDNPNDCSGETAVGVEKEDIEASIESSVANDKEGFYELVVSGRVFIVANCTAVRKIDSGGTLGGLAKIRFLDGEFENITGWIPYEFAVKRP